MRRSIFIGLFALASCSEITQLFTSNHGPEIRANGIVDTHMHVGPRELDRLHNIMQEQGIRWGLNLSGRWPGGGLKTQLDAAKESGRLLVACNLPWFAAARTEKFPTLAAELLLEAHKMGARALKVSKGLGLGVMKYDQTLLSVDDPWLDPIWKAAGELKMPVVIHTGDPKAFWEPVDAKNERFEELTAHPGWSNHGIKGLPSFEALLTQLGRLVARHPKTTFVSVHFGNNAEDPQWVSDQLKRYPNLFIDIAARLPEFGRHPAKLIRAIFIQHADRILFGSDLGVSPDNFLMLGSFGKEPNMRSEAKPFFDAHWRYFETSQRKMPSPTPIQGDWTIDGINLPKDVLRKVYRENAFKLFGPWPKAEKKGRP
jgi:hypothetical protein